MEKRKNCVATAAISLGLLSFLMIGPNYAEEIDLCTKNCADYRKECNKQANLTSNQESHPLLSDSSASRDTGTRMRGLRIAGNATSDSQNDEMQRRRMERYQACEYENDKCQNSCSPKPVSPKMSVILK